ncbi:MAG: helix-turn-helix domain-containing protein [bacterium]|nr:helix-turn-helix domain-containing protein [bacterium]
MNRNLSEYLKELRSVYEYSQAYVAEKLNISRQTYSHYETGRITPPPESLYTLAQLYHVSVDMLLSDRPNPSHKTTKPGTPMMSDAELLPNYLDYVSKPDNKKRLSNLTPFEKKVLFYYSLLDERDQDDILTFMEIKYHNRREGR